MTANFQDTDDLVISRGSYNYKATYSDLKESLGRDGIGATDSSTTPPDSPKNGDLWLDTNTCPPELKVWSDCSGTGQWEGISSSGASQAPLINGVSIQEVTPGGNRFSNQSFKTDVTMVNPGTPQGQIEYNYSIYTEYTGVLQTSPQTSLENGELTLSTNLAVNGASDEAITVASSLDTNNIEKIGTLVDVVRTDTLIGNSSEVNLLKGAQTVTGDTSDLTEDASFGVSFYNPILKQTVKPEFLSTSAIRSHASFDGLNTIQDAMQIEFGNIDYQPKKITAGPTGSLGYSTLQRVQGSGDHTPYVYIFDWEQRKWTQTPTPYDSGSANGYQQATIQNGNRIMACYSNDLFNSTDGGNSWSKGRIPTEVGIAFGGRIIDGGTKYYFYGFKLSNTNQNVRAIYNQSGDPFSASNWTLDESTVDLFDRWGPRRFSTFKCSEAMSGMLYVGADKSNKYMVSYDLGFTWQYVNFGSIKREPNSIYDSTNWRVTYSDKYKCFWAINGDNRAGGENRGIIWGCSDPFSGDWWPETLFTCDDDVPNASTGSANNYYQVADLVYFPQFDSLSMWKKTSQSFSDYGHRKYQYLFSDGKFPFQANQKFALSFLTSSLTTTGQNLRPGDVLRQNTVNGSLLEGNCFGTVESIEVDGDNTVLNIRQPYSFMNEWGLPSNNSYSDVNSYWCGFTLSQPDNIVLFKERARFGGAYKKEGTTNVIIGLASALTADLGSLYNGDVWNTSGVVTDYTQQYLELDLNGTVTGVTGGAKAPYTTYNTSNTVTFPQNASTGNSWDIEIPAGTGISVEVAADNTAGGGGRDPIASYYLTSVTPGATKTNTAEDVAAVALLQNTFDYRTDVHRQNLVNRGQELKTQLTNEGFTPGQISKVIGDPK